MHCVPNVKRIDPRSIDVRGGGRSSRGGPRVVKNLAGRRLLGDRSLRALVSNDIVTSEVLNVSAIC